MGCRSWGFASRRIFLFLMAVPAPIFRSSTGKPRRGSPDLLLCGKSQRLGIIVMGSFSLMHWVVVLFIILIIFGAGKLPRVMGDFAKGIKAFKSGMKEEEETAAKTDSAPQVPPPAAPHTTSTASPSHAAHTAERVWSGR